MRSLFIELGVASLKIANLFFIPSDKRLAQVEFAKTVKRSHPFSCWLRVCEEWNATLRGDTPRRFAAASSCYELTMDDLHQLDLPRMKTATPPAICRDWRPRHRQ